jgi:hypothetical protein
MGVESAEYSLMNKFVIGYDLLKPGQDYESLFEAIKSVGSSWWHCLDSTWIVITNRTAMQVRDHLRPHMDANDRLPRCLMQHACSLAGIRRRPLELAQS